MRLGAIDQGASAQPAAHSSVTAHATRAQKRSAAPTAGALRGKDAVAVRQRLAIGSHQETEAGDHDATWLLLAQTSSQSRRSRTAALEDRWRLD
jgi:hypothetical protein